MADHLTTIVCESPEAVAERSAVDLVQLINDTLQHKERFTIALAGGQTPKMLYSLLAREPYQSQIPWTKLWVFWGDERCVPKEHPDSNFRMASESLLQFVPVSTNHVFRIHGEDAPPQAARDYENEMRRVFKDDAVWPIFDLILLGLGPDGHTASLMPGTPALTLGDRWVVGNVVRSLQTVRITMTLPVLNAARNVWFLVTGAKKAEIFSRVQEAEDPAYPASLIHPEQGMLRWYVDRAVTPQGVPASKTR